MKIFNEGKKKNKGAKKLCKKKKGNLKKFTIYSENF